MTRLPAAILEEWVQRGAPDLFANECFGFATPASPMCTGTW